MNVRVTKKTKKKKNDLSVSIDFILGSILGCTKCKEGRRKIYGKEKARRKKERLRHTAGQRSNQWVKSGVVIRDSVCDKWVQIWMVWTASE